MDCRTAHSHLSAYLDRALPVPMRERLDTHLGVCLPCRRELAQLQTVISWVRDLPAVEPSPVFLQKLCERVEDIPRRFALRFFRRLSGALPLQVAAAVVLAVSTVVLLRMVPQIGQQQTQSNEPSPRVAPQISRGRNVAPAAEGPPFDHMPQELGPALIPLVQVPAARPALTWREEPRQSTRGRPGLSFLSIPRGEAEISELTLRATDPLQAAQHMAEALRRVGGAPLEPQRIAPPMGSAVQGPLKVTISLPAEHYQPLLEAIRQLPGTIVAEERILRVGRELWQGMGSSPWRAEYPQETAVPQFTLVITILPR